MLRRARLFVLGSAMLAAALVGALPRPSFAISLCSTPPCAPLAPYVIAPNIVAWYFGLSADTIDPNPPTVLDLQFLIAADYQAIRINLQIFYGDMAALANPAAASRVGGGNSLWYLATYMPEVLNGQMRAALANAKMLAKQIKALENEIHTLNAKAANTVDSIKKQFPAWFSDPSTFNMPAAKSSSQTAGGNGTLDLSPWLGLNDADHYLRAAFGLYDSETRLSVVPNASVGAGSARANELAGTMGLIYGFNGNYVKGALGLESGHASESSSAPGGATSTGAFGINGYLLDAAVGHMFPLWNAFDPANWLRDGRPPSNDWLRRQTLDGWQSVALALEGRIGYMDQKSGAFTDSSGNMVGEGDAHSTFAGVAARLFATYRYQDLGSIRPYVSVRYDNYFDFSNTVSFPAQAGLPAGQFQFFNNPHNVETAETGVSFTANNGISLTASAVYATFDGGTNYGGTVSLKIPLSIGPSPTNTATEQTAAAALPIVTKAH